MGQGRLSSLSLLAIDRTLVKSLEKTASWYDRVKEHFPERNREQNVRIDKLIYMMYAENKLPLFEGPAATTDVDQGVQSLVDSVTHCRLNVVFTYITTLCLCLVLRK